jgi:hypothetical protein
MSSHYATHSIMLVLGRIGQYDHCLSITQVSGYWRPLLGTQPHLGNIGEVSFDTECKVEVDCPFTLGEKALGAIKSIHPYDESLINVIPLLNHLFSDAMAVSP